MNGYNDYLVTRDAWSAVIQPKSKFVMAIVLDNMVVKHGSCVDPSCSGRVLLTAAKPTCGKYISVFEETTKRSENDQNPDVILSREGPELELKAEVTEQRHNGTPSSALDEDITVFKRV
jgi:purine nucleoside phosphorylase